MKGQLSQEAIVEVAAEEFWNVCRGLEWVRILHQLLGDFVGKPHVIQGDGGVGTIVKVSSPPGMYSIILIFIWRSMIYIGKG